MNTGLWNMDSGLAAAPRPGMTANCQTPELLAIGASPTRPDQTGEPVARAARSAAAAGGGAAGR